MLINIRLAERGRLQQSVGKSRGGFSAKVHVATDSLGCPIKFTLTPVNTADCSMAIPLLEGQEAEQVLADKGYDSDEIIDAVEAMNAKPVIPPRSHRKTQRFYDKNIYKERSAIEYMFGKLKQFRRIATRYDKLASSYLSFIYIGAIWTWLA